MATVTMELLPPGGTSTGTSWQTYAAPGETLGRLLTRLVSERPGFGAVYDPTSRRLGDVQLLVNGRAYHLIGGLTYLLHDGDQLTIGPRQAAGQARD